MILSRREFLKLSSLAFGAALLPPIPLEEGPRQALLLGRPIYQNIVYDRPSFDARKVGVIPAESIFNIFATIKSDDNYYNRTWYETQRGFVHSASIQPVRWQLNQPVKQVLQDGFLGEITVPYSLARTGPGSHASTGCTRRQRRRSRRSWPSRNCARPRARSPIPASPSSGSSTTRTSSGAPASGWGSSRTPGRSTTTTAA